MVDANGNHDWADVGLMLFVALLDGGQIKRCFKCRREPREGVPDWDDWSIVAPLNRFPIAILCPNCQTPQQRAEIAIRQATGPKYVLEGGLLYEQPNPPLDSDDGDDQDGQGGTRSA